MQISKTHDKGAQEAHAVELRGKKDPLTRLALMRHF